MRKYKTPAIALALASFVVVNLALSALFHSNKMTTAKVLTDQALLSTNYEKRKEGPWIWWDTRAYMTRALHPDVAILGSSQMGSAIFSAEAEHRGKAVDALDEREVTRLEAGLSPLALAHPRVFNLSLGGAMVSDHYLIAKALFHGEQKPKVVVLGVNPRDFIDNSLPSASATDTFYFLSPYVNLGKLAEVSFDGPFGWLDYQIKQNLPLKQALSIMKGNEPPNMANIATFTNPEGRGLGTKDSDNKTLGTKVLAAVSGSAGDVRKGVWLIPPGPPRLFIDNTREYVNRYKTTKPACLKGQKAYFEALMSYLHDEHIQTLVVGMPSLDCNRALLPDSFWQEFRGYLSSTATANGATFVDLFADKRFTKDCFLDTVHLNRWGGRQFVSIVSQELTQKQELAKALQAPSSELAGRSAAEKQWH
jgi:hypothetical protein